MKLTMGQRRRLPASDSAIPEKAPDSGSYPVENEANARNALSRASGKPIEATVKAKVKAKFPGIGQQILNMARKGKKP